MTFRKTPLDALHRNLGARMVPFAGYEMPVQYAQGIIAEHVHTREHAGLFDVSHMGQFVLEGPGIAEALERLMPVDLLSLPQNRQTYALLTTADGGVRDDLMVTRWGPERFFLVVNAACKDDDRQWIASQLEPGQTLRELEDQGLLALQGPAAREVMGDLLPQAANLAFLDCAHLELDGIPLHVSCSGYTGEDGYEISVAGSSAASLCERLLADTRVAPVGLGARDSLRLEAGLCLYGHELSLQVSPIEAALKWAISKARRPGGEREGGYPGAQRIGEQLRDGTNVTRVGLRVTGRRPVREGQTVRTTDGEDVGIVTSGGFGPSAGGPIAMASVSASAIQSGADLCVDVRGKDLPVEVVKMPFVKQRYFRG